MRTALLTGSVCLLAVATASAQPPAPGQPAPNLLPPASAPVPAPAAPGMNSVFLPAEEAAVSDRLAATGRPWALCGPRAWASAEYLLWWVTPMNSPDLIQTVPAAAAQVNGTLAPGSVTRAFPDAKNQSFGAFSGVRGSAGVNFDRFGLEGSIFYLQQNSKDAVLSSNGRPFAVALPYVSAGTGQSTALFASLPDQYSGTVAASLDSKLWGADGNVRLPFYTFMTSSTDALVGFRYLELQEGLNTLARSTFPDGGTITVQDSIQTRNRFYGGQVGLASRLGQQTCGVGLDLVSKVALGSVNQRVELAGSNAFTDPGLPASVQPGGLYTSGTNQGVFERDRTALLLEQNVNLTYNVTRYSQVYVGYSIIWLSSVQRPGEAIDQVVNDSRTRFVANPTPSTANRPAFQFNGNDFWTQGVTFGVKVQY